MGTERERVFLVAGKPWRQVSAGDRIEQAYLAVDDDCEVRVRQRGDAWTLTIKSRAAGPERIEVERELTAAEGRQLRSLSRHRLSKIRHVLRVEGCTWEVDVYSGRLDGLVLAEVELDAGEDPRLPDWIGAEVTDDPRYRNVSLATADAPP